MLADANKGRHWGRSVAGLIKAGWRIGAKGKMSKNEAALRSTSTSMLLSKLIRALLVLPAGSSHGLGSIPRFVAIVVRALVRSCGSCAA